MISTIIKDSWSHPWEGFKSCFQNCSQEEIEWVDASYQSCEQEPGWPKTGSISWHLNHVGACKQSYIADIKNPNEDNLETNWEVVRDLFALEVVLDSINKEFIEACEKADPKTAIKGKGGQTLSQYIGIAIRHEIWHAGQIALIRRLYQYYGHQK